MDLPQTMHGITIEAGLIRAGENVGRRTGISFCPCKSHLATKHFLRFAEQQLDPSDSKQGLIGGSVSDRASSRITSSSRDSLYKHFDKLSKEEQIMVLKDAVGRKERLEKLEKQSDRFSELDLNGLSNQEKAEKLIKALSAERERRMQKESAFVEMLNEERAARKQAEENMKQLEQKLEILASAVKGKMPTKLPVLKSPVKSRTTPRK